MHFLGRSKYLIYDKGSHWIDSLRFFVTAGCGALPPDQVRVVDFHTGVADEKTPAPSLGPWKDKAAIAPLLSWDPVHAPSDDGG